MEIPSANRETVSSDSTYAPASVIAEHYRVERELGRGGMATVYLCTDLRSESPVAVKVLRQELGSAVVIERFLREIAFASELDHPRIPKVLGSGVIAGLPYYVMTYIEGESLKKRIEREKQLSIADAIKIACDVIAPTAYAHGRGIVHRDLKPDNILIAKDGVYVLDFGIARAIIESGVDRLTSTGVGVGTPAYMSPEQALGDRNLDARSDIYSLGCVMYEMIAGIPPFVGPTAQVIISRRFAAAPPPLSEVRDSVPESIEAAIDKALARSPADRWATVSDFGAALEACDRGGSSIVRRPGTSRSRHRRAAIVTLLAGVVAASAFAWSAAYREPFASAHRALGIWNLERAQSDLGRAVAMRSDARAHIWLAQVMMLRGAPSPDWKPFVLLAADHRLELPDEDKTRVDALLALSTEEFATACRHFAELAKLERARDPAQFASALAYADCLRQDPVVLPDNASPSGYRFRVSFQLVDSLYEALLDRHSSTSAAYNVLVPRIEQVLWINKGTLRRGILPGATPQVFLAVPSVISDTLAYVPYAFVPTAGIFRTRDPRGLTAAVSRNRQQLRALANKWSLIAPNDPTAHETLAQVLESTGEITGADLSALQQIGLARRLAPVSAENSEQRYLRQLRLASYHVRLYLRSTSFDRAAALADTVLEWPAPELASEDQEIAAEMIAGLAAIRGRPSRASEMKRRMAAALEVRLPSGEIVTLPLALGLDEMALSQYAVFGGSADSVLTIAARLARNITARVPADEVDSWRVAVLRRPLTLAAPVIGPEPVAELGSTADPYVSALIATARHDERRARNLLDSLAKLRGGYAPSEISMDAVYLEAWLRTRLGDTATATRSLDNALSGLPGGEPSVLKNLDEDMAASLVRVMALRAELAGKVGQANIAKAWANAVFILWGQGDPIVGSTLDRVRGYR